ncbi:MAG: proton-conducting transporter transmembrane domain-containing protein [Candidatus Heimdallarchaeota archaeon]
MAEVSINFLLLSPMFLTFFIAIILFGLRKWLSNFAAELATGNMIINTAIFAAVNFKVKASPTKTLYGFYNSTIGIGYSPSTSVQMKVNGFSGWLLIIINTLLILMFVYETTKRREQRRQLSSLLSLLFFSIGMNFSIIANDLFTIFLAWAIVGISLILLLANEQNKLLLRQEVVKAYLLIALALLFLLLGVILSYGFLGSVNLDYIKNHPELLLAVKAQNGLFAIYLIIALFIVGFGLFANLITLNLWMPKTIGGSSATIQQTFTSITGGLALLTIIKVVYVVFSPTVLTNNGYSFVLLIIGLLTAFQGVFLFSYQVAKKKKTAETLSKIVIFALITNLGIVLTGFATGMIVDSSTIVIQSGLLQESLGFTALQIVNVFFAGYLALTAKEHLLSKRPAQEEVINYQGIGKEYPLTVFTFLIGLASLIGLLPTFGGVNIYLLLFSLVKLEFIGVVIALIFVLLLLLVGFLSLLKQFVFDNPPAQATFIQPKGIGADLSFINFINIVIALGIIILGLVPSLVGAPIISNASFLLS